MSGYKKCCFTSGFKCGTTDVACSSREPVNANRDLAKEEGRGGDAALMASRQKIVWIRPDAKCSLEKVRIAKDRMG